MRREETSATFEQWLELNPSNHWKKLFRWTGNLRANCRFCGK